MLSNHCCCNQDTSCSATFTVNHPCNPQDPIAQATITVRKQSDGSLLASGTTNAQGKLTLSWAKNDNGTCPNVTWSASASACPAVTGSIDYTGITTKNVSVVLSCDRYDSCVTFVVTGCRNIPLSDALITVEGPPGGAPGGSGATDGNGQWTFCSGKRGGGQIGPFTATITKPPKFGTVVRTFYLPSCGQDAGTIGIGLIPANGYTCCLVNSPSPNPTSTTLQVSDDFGSFYATNTNCGISNQRYVTADHVFQNENLCDPGSLCDPTAIYKKPDFGSGETAVVHMLSFWGVTMGGTPSNDGVSGDTFLQGNNAARGHNFNYYSSTCNNTNYLSCGGRVCCDMIWALNANKVQIESGVSAGNNSRATSYTVNSWDPFSMTIYYPRVPQGILANGEYFASCVYNPGINTPVSLPVLCRTVTISDVS